MDKHEELEGIKGLIFDCYNTLIDIKTDEDSMETYRTVCNWLIYQGVKIGPEEFLTEYKKGWPRRSLKADGRSILRSKSS